MSRAKAGSKSRRLTVRTVPSFIAATLALAVAGARAGPVSFSGSANTSGQYDDIAGAAQNRPAWIGTAALAPVLGIYGFKVRCPVTISTLDRSTRQSFNRLSPTIRKGWFDLGLVDVRPTYSPFTLNGQPVRGAGISLTPGILRLAATTGETRRAVKGSDTTEASFRQTLSAARVGVGRPERGFSVNLNLVRAQDSYDSAFAWRQPLPRDSVDTTAVDTIDIITPKENTVASLDFGLRLFGNRFSLSGEVAGSQFSRDLRAEKLEIDNPWVPAFVQPRLSSQHDLALNASAALELLAGGRLSAAFRRVGPAFRSLGSPYLLADVQSLSGAVAQPILGNDLVLDLGYGQSRDNLSGLKMYTTTTRSIASGVVLSAPRLPRFSLSYRPSFRLSSAAAESVRVDDRTHLLVAGLSRGFRLGRTYHSPALDFSLTSYDDRNPATRGSYASRSMAISCGHTLAVPVSFNWRVGNTTGSASTGWNCSISAGTGFLSPRLNPTFTVGLQTSTAGGSGTSRLDLALSTPFRVNNAIGFNLGARRSAFRNPQADNQNYDETAALLGLSARW